MRTLHEAIVGDAGAWMLLLLSAVSVVLLIACVNVAIGLAVAWPLASFVEAFLFDVRPHDPGVYAGAATLLAACGLIAAFVPARRAARVDPIVALRVE